MARIVFEPPYYPIVYLRGYAMTQGEIEDTVATPFMGFNLGATKHYQGWQGDLQRYYFESPLIRLMQEYAYAHSYHDGRNLADEPESRLPTRCVVIHRYYDQASRTLGEGIVPSIQDAANDLSHLIGRLRDRICGDDAAARAAFKCYLVAHSMGGLIVRCFLQNDAVGDPALKATVDKVFTYATPHNGIEMLGLNVPRIATWNDADNFNRTNIARDLALPAGSTDTRSLDNKFPADRFFCLIGTDAEDYTVAWGLSRKGAGKLSDGLVRIENAYVQGAPRAFVHRSHSGHFGIVNSEEGYQNLVRFLFGTVRVDGKLVLEALPLPAKVQRAKDEGKEVRASYHIEVIVSPRGALAYDLTRRRVEDGSAVFRKYDEIFHPDRAGLQRPRHPVLFSTCLSRRYAPGKTLVFTLDLQVNVPVYEVDRRLWWDDHIPGQTLYRQLLKIEARPPAVTGDVWRLRYAPLDDHWHQRAKEIAATQQDDGSLVFPVQLSSGKGFAATLELRARPWN